MPRAPLLVMVITRETVCPTTWVPKSTRQWSTTIWEKREIIGFSRKCNNNPPKPQKCVSVVKFEINHVKRVIYCTKTPTSHFFLEHFMATEKGPVADWKWISPSKSTSSYDKYWIFITVEHSLIIFIIFKEGKKNIVEQDWNDNHLRCKNLSCKGHLRF